MSRREKEWHVQPYDAAAIEHLARSARVSPVVAQLLLNRGVCEPAAARRYLDATLTGLHKPMDLPGAPEAAERIWKAIRDKEKICIFGDYDADGVTGTAILVGLIERLGGSVEFYIPHRLDEGYGLNSEAIRLRKETGVSLVVTVDCGITAVEEAREARKLGIDLIITDHHEAKAELPDALIVHPRKPGSSYPFAGLSGSGVAHKLAWAVAQQASGSEKVSDDLREFLMDAVGIAALGLVADVVPLRDENRIYVRHGLKRLAGNPPLGLKALIDIAQLKKGQILSEDVSFRIAPRLNAAGRLGCAMLVVELLTTKNPARARELAMALDGFNQQRQTIERRILVQAKEMVEAGGYRDAPAIVLGCAEWHAGVVGIVASRLVEHYGRPVVLIALKNGDEISTGSGRSLPGLPLHSALSECEGMLEGHGGHAMAAGVKVRPSRLDAFRERLCHVASQSYAGTAPVPRLTLDAEVPLASMTLNLLKELDHLEPYGSENPRPKFLATGVRVDGEPRKVGNGERHVSLKLRQGNTSLKAIAFGQADRFEELTTPGAEFSLAFTPRINEWNGYRSVQVEVVDFRLSEPQA
jgi:single-stranded-DNA-specific exonuclease